MPPSAKSIQQQSLNEFFERKVLEYNQAWFIEKDPVSIPHGYTKKQDIEIAGFFAAVFSWGNRTTIIAKSKELMQLMDNAPFDFIINHQEQDLKKFLPFKHRTFNTTDLLYFIQFLKSHYKGELTATISDRVTAGGNYKDEISLESAFTIGLDASAENIRTGLVNFNKYFFSLSDAPARTAKHISTPERKSACKRLNMFLRWMVRQDKHGVDFGIWQSISPAQLICPLDVHVVRVARRFGLLTRNNADWQAAEELTLNLKRFDPADPVKYDYALFGLGIEEKY
jgi:uncharacterized protein (TIGR02757 family)